MFYIEICKLYAFDKKNYSELASTRNFVRVYLADSFEKYATFKLSLCQKQHINLNQTYYGTYQYTCGPNNRKFNYFRTSVV